MGGKLGHVCAALIKGISTFTQRPWEIQSLFLLPYEKYKPEMVLIRAPHAAILTSGFQPPEAQKANFVYKPPPYFITTGQCDGDRC